MSHLPWTSRAWYRFCRAVLRVLTLVHWDYRAFGQQHIPRQGGVLVIANHQSHFDPMLVGMGCPRRMNYLARESLFRFRPFGWLIGSVGAIPLDVEGSGLSGIKEALRRLKAGEMVLIFPEGTRTFDGEMNPLRPGFTALAVRSKAAILPVAVDGAFQAWPRSRTFPGPGKLRVRYEQPVLPAEYATLDEPTLIRIVEARIRAGLERLRADAGAGARGG